MNTPWFVYIILIIAIAISGAVMIIASMDPEGRARNVANNSFYLGALLCIGLVVLGVLDLARWIST